MKYVGLFIAVCLFQVFIQAHEQSEVHHNTIEERNFIITSCLKDLEELGYCVIPDVLSSEEAEVLFSQHNEQENFLGSAGQTEEMGGLRQDLRILYVCSEIWNALNRIVCIDGMSIMEPWIGFFSESSLATQLYLIQGLFLFEDSFEDEGGFYCIPKSHLRFSEFNPVIERINAMEIPRDEKIKLRNAFLDEFFERENDESGNSYCKMHITAPPGSLILWDSRTIHWSQNADIKRSYTEDSKAKMVGYVFDVSKARLTNEGKILRNEAFENGVFIGHNPSLSKLKYTKDQLHSNFEHYLEDPWYIKLKIKLIALGQSLLGDTVINEKEVFKERSEEDVECFFGEEVLFLFHQIFSNS